MAGRFSDRLLVQDLGDVRLRLNCLLFIPPRTTISQSR
jgi:hypothetical protein